MQRPRKRPCWVSAASQEALLSHQPVGPNIDLLIELIKKYPATRFSTIVDDARIVEQLSAAVSRAGVEIDVLMDLDVGMHRTGIAVDSRADALYGRIAQTGNLRPAGLHVYDGQIRETDSSKRQQLVDEAFVPVLALRDRLLAAGLSVPQIIAGGTPSFSGSCPAFRPHLQPRDLRLLGRGVRASVPRLEIPPRRLAADSGHQ